MIEGALQTLERDGFILPAEGALARRSLELGINDHTIGYELEVLPSAAGGLGALQCGWFDNGALWILWKNCVAEMLEYGFGVDDDGLYELQSPASTHPKALEIATRGIVRTGWLPGVVRRGAVTAHVSVGIADRTPLPFSYQQDLTRLLRTVELAGRATTAQRLAYPLKKAEVDHDACVRYGWNYGGLVGVSTSHRSVRSNSWEGDNQRIEFRTLGYYSPSQLGRVLDTMYYLTRGLFSFEGTPARKVYDELDQWLKQYFLDKRLPEVEQVFDEYESLESLTSYLRPFIVHMRKNRSELRGRVNECVDNLREEFGCTDTI
ncbi:MAG: hypothetical protein U0520_04445 [Candidatus Saccharimonadales bacterium]